MEMQPREEKPDRVSRETECNLERQYRVEGSGQSVKDPPV